MKKANSVDYKTDYKNAIIRLAIKADCQSDLSNIYTFAKTLLKSGKTKINTGVESAEITQKRMKAYGFIESLPADVLDNVLEYMKSME